MLLNWNPKEPVSCLDITDVQVETGRYKGCPYSAYTWSGKVGQSNTYTVCTWGGEARQMHTCVKKPFNILSVEKKNVHDYGHKSENNTVHVALKV